VIAELESTQREYNSRLLNRIGDKTAHSLPTAFRIFYSKAKNSNLELKGRVGEKFKALPKSTRRELRFFILFKVSGQTPSPQKQ
jgi:hypothetical protein